MWARLCSIHVFCYGSENRDQEWTLAKLTWPFMQKLLEADVVTEEARWSTLDNAELDQEIQAYRDSIQAITDQLADRGISGNPGEQVRHATSRALPKVEVHFSALRTGIADSACSFELQISNFKFQISNLKFEVNNLNWFEVNNLKYFILSTHDRLVNSLAVSMMLCTAHCAGMEISLPLLVLKLGRSNAPMCQWSLDTENGKLRLGAGWFRHIYHHEHHSVNHAELALAWQGEDRAINTVSILYIIYLTGCSRYLQFSGNHNPQVMMLSHCHTMSESEHIW